MLRVGQNCHLACLKAYYNNFFKHEAFAPFVYSFTKTHNTLFSSDKIGIYIDMLDLLKTLTPQFTEQIESIISSYILDLNNSGLKDPLILKIFMHVLFKILKKQLIDIQIWDDFFCNLLQKFDDIEFQKSFVKLLRCFIFDNDKTLQPEQILSTFNYQKQYIIQKKEVNGIEEIYQFLEDINIFIYQREQIKTQQCLGNLTFIKKQEKQKTQSIFQEIDEEFLNLVNEVFQSWLIMTTSTDIQKFMEQLQYLNIITDETRLTKFFSYLTEICVNFALTSIYKNQNALNKTNKLDYSLLSQFTRLITICIKLFRGDISKSGLLEKILSSLLIVLTKHHEFSLTKFSQKPFFKLFYNLLCDLTNKDYGFDSSEITQFIEIFLQFFLKLQPLKYPGFAFAWLELIFDRNLLPIIFENNDLQVAFHELLISLFRFFKYITNDHIIVLPTYQQFYKGMLRILLVLLHDFAEFLSKFSFNLCSEIPNTFIQVRNMILMTFPKNSLKLPNFNKKLQIVLNHFIIHFFNKETLEQDFNKLPEMYSVDLENKIQNENFKALIMDYLTTKNETAYQQIYDNLIGIQENSEFCIKYDIVNVLVLTVPYLLFSTEQQQPLKCQQLKPLANAFLLRLLQSSTYQIREALITSILNQIRYPNKLSKYFMDLFSKLFSESKTITDEILLEQVITLLVERLIVKKPHPWCQVYFFFELQKNTDINLKSKSFWQNNEHIFNQLLKGFSSGNENDI